MPSIENVTFTGVSGRKYEFTAWTIDPNFLDVGAFRDVGAVYIFTRRDGNHYRALYIGQTEALRTRLSNHEQWACVRKHGVNSICIHPENNSRTRLEIERDIRDAVRPPCNKET